jgi:hypothetical protein
VGERLIGRQLDQTVLNFNLEVDGRGFTPSDLKKSIFRGENPVV